MSYLPLSNLGILTNQNYLKNPDAESSTSGFNVGSVTLSSGIPTGAPTIGSVTGFSLTRDTTNRLVGGASFEITAGSGGTTPAGAAIISDIITINDIDLAKVLSFGFGYKLVTDGANLDFSGSATQSMELWVYNIGLAQWIQPQGYRGINTKNAVGKVTATFQSDALNTSNRNQYRLAIIFKNSISSLTEFVFDQAFLNNSPTLFGAAVTDWQDFTPTGSFTTNTTYTGKWRRVGDSAELNVRMLFSGAPNSTVATINLPFAWAIDSSKVNTTQQYTNRFGDAEYLTSGISASNLQVVQGTSVNVVQMLYQSNIISGGQALVTQAAPYTIASGDQINAKFIVPIAGWSSNVSMAESSTFSISSYLANGTRVTTTPTKLGEYRSQSKTTASSNTFVDAAPSTAPSASLGLRLHCATYVNSQAAGIISRYEVFVGTNKTISVNLRGSDGVTPAQVGYFVYSATLERGTAVKYNKQNGVVTIDCGTSLQTTTSVRTIGLANLTGDGDTDGYIDIIVSENALQVGVQEPRSEVYVYGGNGYGSTNTVIRRFTTISKNNGTAITYADSSTAGNSFTINEDGIYAISYVDATTTGTRRMGISLNSTQLTTSIGSISISDVVAQQGVSLSIGMNLATTLQLRAGDVIRAHTEGSLVDGVADTAVSFRIVKVSN